MRSIRLFDPAMLSRLSIARDYLASRYNERTTLEDSARHASLSPFYFNRLFSQAFGETPHAFVARLRMDEAKKLLLAGNHSVTDVCFEVGYESLGSFTTRFHSQVGLSPGAFQRESRRVFRGLGRPWPLFYVPACYQVHFLGS
jgi:AraC-like DNA-binding protein